MSRNRRRNENSIEIASVVKWALLAGILGVFGLCCVYMKIQMHAVGSEKKSLEREYDDLVAQNEAIRGQIIAMTSRVELERRVAEGFIQLVPIADQQIVRLQPSRTPRGEMPQLAETDILPVVNTTN